MYNQEVKEKYLEYCESNNVLEGKDLPNMILDFQQASAWEVSKDKDLASFSKEEILESYMMLYYTRVAVLKVLNDRFADYAAWMINEGLIDCENAFKQITYSELEQCISIMDFKKRLISPETLQQIIDQQSNSFNKFILLALYCGIRGEMYCELTEAKAEHFHIENSTMDIYRVDENYKPYLHRMIKVPKKLIEYGLEAANTYVCYSDPGRVIAHLYGDKIIKDRATYPLDDLFATTNRRFMSIQNKIKQMKNYSGCRYLNGQNIYNSGLCHAINELATEVGVSPLEVIETGSFDEIEKQFGIDTSKNRLIKSLKKYLV